MRLLVEMSKTYLLDWLRYNNCGLDTALIGNNMSPSKSQEKLIDILCCPICRGLLQVFSDKQFVCKNCKNNFPLIDGIPFFLPHDSLGSRLEEIDYDEVHSIDARAISSIGASWNNLIHDLQKVGENAVEIGAGTGALTLGLLGHKTFTSIVATDISLKFLRHLKNKGGGITS